MGPRRKRAEARRALVASALGLAARRPFGDLTVAEIAAGAGISRSAFYLHFHDKRDLLEHALRGVGGELLELAGNWWRGDGSPAQRVRRALGGFVSVYAERIELLRLVGEVAAYDREIERGWRRVIEAFIDAAAEQIAQEQRDGLMPSYFEPRPAAEALMWMTERNCAVYLRDGDRAPAELTETLTRVWVAALYPGVIAEDALRPSGSEEGMVFGRDSPGRGSQDPGSDASASEVR